MARTIHPKTTPPTMKDIVAAMTRFAQNPYDEYDSHMFKTGHYPQMNAGLSAACMNGHLAGPKIVDFGCGSGVLISHIISSLLSSEILASSQKSPIVIYGVDATQTMMDLCKERTLRRIAKLIRSAKLGDDLSVYGVDTETNKRFRIDNSELIFQKNHVNLSEVSLMRDIPEVMNGKNVVVPKELLKVRFILQDVLELSSATLGELKGATTVLVSYCFHWFLNKSEVARRISDILDPAGKFISIEEWPLRVTPPSNSSEEEMIFHKELGALIESATTPIEVPKELYTLFSSNGLKILQFTGEPDKPIYLKNSIDGYHDMYFGVFKKSVSTVPMSGWPGSELYFS